MSTDETHFTSLAMNRLDTELNRLYLPLSLPLACHTPVPGVKPGVVGGTSSDSDCLESALARLPAPLAVERGVRALALGVAKPAHWDSLASVWHGVQSDLGLPAPAIAVSGTHGHWLWFSLAEAVPVVRAAAFLEGLRARYLAHLPTERVLQMPDAAMGATGANKAMDVNEDMGANPFIGSIGLIGGVDAISAVRAAEASSDAWREQALGRCGQAASHIASAVEACLPSQEVMPGQWSAFVAPDLARIFEDEPWLDRSPGPNAQADLLARLASTPLADFNRALARLCPPPLPSTPALQPSPQVDLPAPGQAGAPTPGADAIADAGMRAARAGTEAGTGTGQGQGQGAALHAPAHAPVWAAPGQMGPRRFLLGVMNDPQAEMAWRMEAAKALLPLVHD